VTVADDDLGVSDGDDLDAVVASLGDPADWVFVVDFDGTLSPIVDHPEDAAPAPGAVAALTALAARTEVALLSGRALDDLLARLGEVPTDVLIVGGHGSEARLPDGTREALSDPEAAREVLDELEADLVSRLDTAAGWQVERKSTSLAVHHRRVPDAQVAAELPEVHAILEDATDRGPGFSLLAGKAVLELKVSGVDKGVALRWIADRCEGRRPVVIGDDVTDEDAFEAALARDGEAVRVAESVAPTSARHRLRDPARVVTLLRAVVGDRDTGTR
jgi:trehalose-phosphatase